MQAKQSFQGVNLQGVRQGDLYVVYSYGSHWPLFIFDYSNGQWYENSDRCSCTTSKHRAYAHPLKDTTKLCCSDMKRKALNGVVATSGAAYN